MRYFRSFALVASIVAMLIAPLAIAGMVAGAGKDALPSSHMIANVPWHEQMNGLFCGAAATEIVYDYWGPDIDQKQIADVVRSSSSGTWTYDIVRGGQFSYMSAAQGYFFPNDAPIAGYAERSLGYASFSYSSDSFWLPELKGLIAADIPVIVLMNYYPTGGGGHYRVVIGYDDALGMIYFSDPWGRDTNHLTQWTGIIAWTYAEFQSGWNYAEYGLAHPYFGCAIIPWKVDVSIAGKLKVGSTVTITAKVAYTCPKPFGTTQFPASASEVKIALPDGMKLISGSPIVSLGDIEAGVESTVMWKVMVQKAVNGKPLTVTADGIVSGHVPEAWWAGNNNYYPPYDYTDAIGGEKTIIL